MDVKQGTHQTGRHEPPSITQHDKDQLHYGESITARVISIEQLQRLVQLLDRSDVSELEFKLTEEGTRLVLRKVKPSENHGRQEGAAITSHLVGIFHTWAKPRGGALIAAGDHVNVGQLVATIESLNVINEVESSFAGRVVEILVLEGQSVEYGQKLMVIDTSAEGEGQ